MTATIDDIMGLNSSKMMVCITVNDVLEIEACSSMIDQ
jgi:hypothetical protein